MADPSKILNKDAKKKYDSLNEPERHKVLQGAKELKTQSEMYAAKVVHDLYYLTCNKDDDLKKDLDSILPYNKAGFMLGQFPNFKDKPVFRLMIVPKDYELDLYAPPKYVTTLYNTLAFMLQCATIYHIVMLQSNTSLIDSLRRLRPDIDFSRLLVDEKNKTLYFDESCDWRIGVSCIWIDENDNVIGHPPPVPRPPLPLEQDSEDEKHENECGSS